jgi:hypothetical protein
MGEDRSRPARENRRDPSRVPTKPKVTDGIDAPIEGEQIPAVDPPPDETSWEAERNQLAPGDDPVLPLGEPANQLGRASASPIATPTSIRIAFATYFLANAMHAGKKHLVCSVRCGCPVRRGCPMA